MDLRNLKVNEIKDLTGYYNFFGDYEFFNKNNLRIDSYTSFPNKTIDACNRDAINNYLDLIEVLFRNFDYTPIEISAQLAIIDDMFKSLGSEFTYYYNEVKSYDNTKTNNYYADWENEQDYRNALQRFDLLSEIKDRLNSINLELTSKYDILMSSAKR